MASQHRHLFTLRIVTQRIAATHPDRLPHITSQLADLVISSKSIFDGSYLATSKPIPDIDVIVHKFNTQLSTLLQDKNSGSRWTAIVLIKTLIGVGSHDVLQTCSSWVRSIVGILRQKNEHSAVKKVAILCLVKIFLATQDYPNLKREITTPSLPQFITHCLSSTFAHKDGVYKPRQNWALLRTTLQAFITLLPRHPAIFRTFRQDFRSMLAPLLSPTPSTVSTNFQDSHVHGYIPGPIRFLAQRLLALLPCCAPNNVTATEWSESLAIALKQTNRTADEVFRSIRELSVRNDSSRNHTTSKSAAKNEVEDEVADILQLPGWRGISAGVERLVGNIQIVEAHIATINPAPVALPIAQVWAVMERLLSVFRPCKRYQPQVNHEIERDEREALWAQLSEIHSAAIRASITLARRLDMSAFSIGDIILGRLCLVHEYGSPDPQLRSTIYRAGAFITMTIGPAMPKQQASALLPLLQSACEDVREYVSEPSKTANGDDKKQMGSGALLSKNTSKDEPVPQNSVSHKQVSVSAMQLLEAVLVVVRSDIIPLPLRATIDGTLILAQERDAMLASVLNPPRQIGESRQISSILPFLARAHPQQSSVESLLRSRLPPIRNHGETIPDSAETESSAGDLMEVESLKSLSQDDQERQVSYGNTSGPVKTLPISTSSLEPSATSEVQTVDAVLSPKRARFENSEHTIQINNEEDLPDPKKLRTEFAENVDVVESQESKKAVKEVEYSVKWSEVEQMSGEAAPPTEIDVVSKGESGSEGSATPEFVLPDDLGASTDEDEDEDTMEDQ